MAKKKQAEPGLGYKTEAQLKADALDRKRQEELLAQARKPKSESSKKAENYWYHYRGLTIAGVIMLALTVMFVRDVFFRTKPDVSIIMVTSQYVPQEYLEQFTAAIEAKTGDINGDGKVYVAIDYIPYTPMDIQKEMEAYDLAETVDLPEDTNDYNYTMKLMTILAAATDPVYILDEANYQYLKAMGGEEDSEPAMFADISRIPGGEGDALPLAATILETDEIAPYFKEHLSFYFRQIRITKKTADYNEDCLQFLEELAAK